METLEAPVSMTQHVPETGVITFLAYKPERQLPIVCTPLQDKSGKLYTGQGAHGYYETLTLEEKNSLPFVFDYDTRIVIENQKTLNLDDPFDKAVWKWLRRHPYISVDKAAGEGSRDAVFYVANPIKEAKQRIDKSAKVDEARPAVRKLSETDRVRAAKALGLDTAEAFAAEMVLDWLLNKASTDPEAVLAVIDPKAKARVNATIAFQSFVKYKVIERQKDGAYYYGGPEGINLGHVDSMVIDYLLDPENSERVKGMKSMLAERSKKTEE